MSHRVRCRSCRTAFLVDDDRRAACPKCGARVVSTLPTIGNDAPPVTAETVFVPADPAHAGRRGRRIAIAALALLTVGGVAVALFWPALKQWWNPVPKDPVEYVAYLYLQALVKGDAVEIEKLGTLEIPPASARFSRIRRDTTRNHRVQGSFAPLTAFHARINASYTFDPESGRFVPKNPLGPAAETLDALHDAKAKAEQEKTAEKIKSGNPDDLFDAAEAMAKSMAALSEGALAEEVDPDVSATRRRRQAAVAGERT